jgi:spore germination protein GerM
MSRPSHSSLAALAVILALAACGDDRSAPATTTATTAGATVTVYFASEAGGLVAEERPAPAGADPLDAALAALADGPSGPGLLPALPPGTRVLGTAADGRVATVDLSAELESGYPSGGSAAELALVAPLVRTAAEAAGAERVRILVEGRAPAPAGGQIDLSQPLAPADVAAGG